MFKLSFKDWPILTKTRHFVKENRGIILLGFLVVSVIIAVFLLGIITGKNAFKTEPILLEGVTPVDNLLLQANITSLNKTAENGAYVASSKGKMYYPVNCGAANNLKQENRIYFQTAIEAEAAGYKRSTACP
jgi:flagellar basal body-associated protein FliL